MLLIRITYKCQNFILLVFQREFTKVSSRGQEFLTECTFELKRQNVLIPFKFKLLLVILILTHSLFLCLSLSIPRIDRFGRTATNSNKQQ